MGPLDHILEQVIRLEPGVATIEVGEKPLG